MTASRLFAILGKPMTRLKTNSHSPRMAIELARPAEPPMCVGSASTTNCAASSAAELHMRLSARDDSAKTSYNPCSPRSKKGHGKSLPKWSLATKCGNGIAEVGIVSPAPQALLWFAAARLCNNGEREQNLGGIPGRFCANWLRISKKVPSKSLIP